MNNDTVEKNSLLNNRYNNILWIPVWRLLGNQKRKL